MIKLIRNYPYDNNYSYTKTFSSKTLQEQYFNSFESIVEVSDNEDSEHGYIKEGESFCVYTNYDELVNLGVNYLIFDNGYKKIYAFITSKEYVNDEVTRLNYEIDVIQTFMFDFSIKKSFIERKKIENINELTDYDEGIDIGEHYISNSYDVLTKDGYYFAMFGGFKDYNVVDNVLTQTPFYNSSRPITKIDGIVYPFMLIALDTEIGINAFYNYLVDLPNLLGIIRFPNCSYTVTDLDLPLVKIENNTVVKTTINCPKIVTSVTGHVGASGGIAIPKTEITDFFPYTYYVLTDGETEPLIMHPQHLLDSLSIKSMFALSHTPVERFYPNYYKGDTTGNVYNITNASVMMLPVGTNGGLETISANANQIQQQKTSVMNNVLIGVTLGVVGLATAGLGAAAMVGTLGVAGVLGATVMGAGNLAGKTAQGLNSVQENMARNKDLELTPSTIKSYGTPSTRDTFGNDKVRVLKYTIKEEYKTRLLNYIERYGNKYNNYGIVDIKNYSGFIKFVQPDLDGKIDNMYINKITSILEGGIFIE